MYRNEIIIPGNENDIVVRTLEINYIKAAGWQSIIFFKDGSNLKVNCNLGLWEKKLSEKNFARIHKSYIVNIEEIAEVARNRSFILLKNNSRIPVGRQKMGCLASLVGLSELRPKNK